MNFDTLIEITEYIKTQNSVFYLEDLQKYLRKKGCRASKDDLKECLYSFDSVFPLVNGGFISRAAVFTNKYFSFQPSKEEVEKGSFVIGHRCMPFVNSEVPPDSIVVTNDGKVLDSHPQTYSLNLAFDVFALYGEGYVIPYVFNDKANDKIKIASINKVPPRYIDLTSWPLDALCPDGKFNYGDRVLCRVMDWGRGVVEMTVLRGPKSLYEISEEDCERDQWFIDFEEAMLANFDKNGPGESIEQQLAFLFLENNHLMTKNCGSVEEFLMHTKKLSFKPYGVESRIWRSDEEIPFVGKWTEETAFEKIYTKVTTILSANILDFYLTDAIYDEIVNNKPVDYSAILKKMIPADLNISAPEQKIVLLHFKKRHDILISKYNEYEDYPLADLRHRIMILFSKASSLLTSIALKCNNLEKFPQQELTILFQLFVHISHIIDEFANECLKDKIPVDDIYLSLEGMEETFEEVSYVLHEAMRRYKKNPTNQ